MKIVVASTSPIKIEACKLAFGKVADVEIIPVNAPSGIAKQPSDGRAITGAYNRVSAARALVPDADVYVGIESGIDRVGYEYFDRAVVVIEAASGRSEIGQSEAVAFPSASVAKAKRRGFETCTVGMVMEEQGIVVKHDDPHLTLAGKSRTDYIAETVQRVARHFGTSS